MKVLVTGGAGFIGSHVAHRLNQQGHTVDIIDDLSGGYRRNTFGITLWNVDITDEAATDAALDMLQPDVIVHCAAYAAEGLSHWMRRYNYIQNLVGWANVANAAARNQISRVVVCSSMAVYGSQPPPFDEDTPPAPEDPYGAAKTALEADVKALGNVFDIEWNIIRPHNVYGPGQNLADPYRNVVAIFTRQALAGEPITVYGDGKQTRAFSFIDDVAGVVADAAVGDWTGRIVNVGGENPVPILDLARLVKDVTWSTSPITHLPERYEVPDAYCNHRVLREIYGEWDPTELFDGYPAMAEWARTIEIADRRLYDYEVTERMYEPWKR